jgi:hypothetical protein
MKCAICGITVDTVDEAVEEGWTPYFYDGDKEHEFACPGCSQTILRVDDNGEMGVKEEFRGKMKYLDDGREKSGEDHLQIGIAVLENEPGKLN